MTDLIDPKVYADGELYTAEKANLFSNITRLGYEAGGFIPGAAGDAARAMLGYTAGAAEPFGSGGPGVWVAGWGNVVDLRIVAQMATTVAVSSTGSVSATTLGTITKAEWQPRQLVPLATTGGARQIAGYISNNGAVILTHVGGTGSIQPGTLIAFSAHYVRRGLTT